MQISGVYNPRTTPASAEPPALVFPTFTSAATTVLTLGALALAAAGVHWGLAPVYAGAVLSAGWLYVNVALCMAWFAVWPITAVRGDWHARPATQEWLTVLTMVASALPALLIAGYLRQGRVASLTPPLALQAGFALFVLGLLQCRGNTGWAGGLVATTAALVGVGFPAAAYLQAAFLPGVSQGWFIAVPQVAIARAAEGAHVAAIWWAAAIYGVAGMVLWGFGAAIAAA